MHNSHMIHLVSEFQIMPVEKIGYHDSTDGNPYYRREVKVKFENGDSESFSFFFSNAVNKIHAQQEGEKWND